PIPEPTDPKPPAPEPGWPDKAFTPEDLAAEEERLYELTNQARAQAGLKPLKLDPHLIETAREKSVDMRDNNYFGHISPRLGTPFDQMHKAGIAYRTAGENLAGAPTADAAHRALMNSPGHKANILNPNFTQLGIGIAVGGPYGIYFTQQFTG
ncbi:MAG TPA: CAP domain-containing protein, partial [bacterium]|nr:CAP domain-containing protein [bacterium]